MYYQQYRYIILKGGRTKKKTMEMRKNRSFMDFLSKKHYFYKEYEK